jgi:hypothetical protein
MNCSMNRQFRGGRQLIGPVCCTSTEYRAERHRYYLDGIEFLGKTNKCVHAICSGSYKKSSPLDAMLAKKLYEQRRIYYPAELRIQVQYSTKMNSQAETSCFLPSAVWKPRQEGIKWKARYRKAEPRANFSHV